MSFKIERVIADYAELMKALVDTCIVNAEFTNEDLLTRTLIENPQLIVILNHSTALSWIPAMSFMAFKTNELGGSDRTPIGILDQFFYKTPLTQPLARFVSQSDSPLKYDDLKEVLSDKSRKIDIVIFPEGANAFFGDLEQIQEFRSTRFLDLAFDTDTPILMVTHRGSENWSVPVQIPGFISQYVNIISPFFSRMIDKFGFINAPWINKKIDHFKMKARFIGMDELKKMKENSSDTDDFKQKINQLMEKDFASLK